jgi:hypothetical protein
MPAESPPAAGDQPAAPREPMTAERLVGVVDEMQNGIDIQILAQALQTEQTNLSNVKLLHRLLPAGGITKNAQQLRKEGEQHLKRINLLMAARLELEDGKPLPLPSGLEVVSGLATPE